MDTSIKKYFKSFIRNFDFPLFITYVVLILFGLVMIYSASMMVAVELDNAQSDKYFKAHLLNITIAGFFFTIAAILPYKNYAKVKLMKAMLYILAGLYLYLLFFGVGRETTGSKSWVDLGLMTFQPSEYAKLFLILYLSGSIYNKGKSMGDLTSIPHKELFFPILIWLSITFAIGLETDLGAIVIVAFIAFSIFIISGISGKILFRYGAILTILVSATLGALALIKGDNLLTASRLGRFQVLGNPFEYATGSGYQIINGYLAIGGGGLKGVGLGQSIQKLGYLPEPQTDFIMAIIAEEIGIKGVALVIFGLGYIVLRAFYIAMNTKDPLARMIAGGIGGWIGFQTFINLGGVSGIIPLTGVTLPFISYGGSSILILSIAFGILLNISMQFRKEKRK